MINRPKPPPHILKRLKEEEKAKKAKRQKRSTEEDPKRMTANSFGVKLQAETTSEGIRTQYPFKPPLRKIQEKNEDEEPYRMGRKKDEGYLSEQKAKRGKSMNAKFLKSNGFSKNGLNNTSYQSNFHDTAISTSTSKHFISSPAPNGEEKRKINRSESLIARST